MTEVGLSSSRLRVQTLEVLREHGHEHQEEAFTLSSGQLSHDYIDGKRALSSGSRLRVVADAVVELAQELDVKFDAVGGLTMGADAIAHAVSVLAGCMWFSVRKEAKEHGKQALVEGADLQGVATLLVDDVVTTGSSILKALEAVNEAGGSVVLAIALCDRGESAGKLLQQRGILYQPLVTYSDLGIDPVG